MHGLFFVSLQKISMAQLVITGDGSHTLFIHDMDEHYHSTFGALTESLHVFIRNGLDCFAGKPEISVFETGFGTGLNALLTVLQSKKMGIKVRYFALEKYPVDPLLVKQLNYPHLLKETDKDAERLFAAIHDAEWEIMTEIQPFFHLKKMKGDMCSFIPDTRYDLVYYDAFAPDKQPEMWTGDILHSLVSAMKPGGIFTTYCVKGSVKRMLKDCGLTIEKLAGPPGKREILRGVKG
jgi:tRNA U34 5-methylaminomethyl-2-thiouridine-forming methyltransferase MnmC